jgi:hypothetical protein
MITDNTNSVRLYVKGFHIPSFKNSKMLTRGKLITNPKMQRQMEEIIRSLGSQLLSCARTLEGETLTGPQAQSLIASLLPEDDSRQWIPELVINSRDCDKGNEGAIVEINRV